MIGRIYRWLFDTHRHEWETIKTEELVRTDGTNSRIGTLFVLRCKSCGEIKARNVGIWS